MRFCILIALTSLAAAVLGGCPPKANNDGTTGGTNGNGNGEPNSTQNDPNLISGADPNLSGTDPNNSAGGTGTGGSNGGSNGAGNFSGCGTIDLQGFWRENDAQTHYVAIDHVGQAVIATYLEPSVCDHRDGSGTSDTTEDDFIGNIANCQITGSLSLCQYGCTTSSDPNENDPNCVNGWHDNRTFTGTVSADGKSISAHWVGTDGTEGDFTLDRLGCEPRLADSFGLTNPASAQWQRTDISDSGFEFSLSNGQTLANPQNFHSDYDGAILSIDSSGDDRVITVELVDGTEVAYHFTGTALVNVGDHVAPSTPIGQIAAFSETLGVTAVDKDGNQTSPDCGTDAPYVNP